MICSPQRRSVHPPTTSNAGAEMWPAPLLALLRHLNRPSAARQERPPLAVDENGGSYEYSP